MIITIDGPGGSGKSTVARALAAHEAMTYLDTGAMYRAVTLACLEAGVDLADADAVAEVAEKGTVGFAPATEPGGAPRVLWNGADVTEAIRTAQVDENVSRVSAIPAVREAMTAEQRRIATTGDLVADGRDMGTVVFPDAEVKVFLTADAQARARRRTIEREGGDPQAAGSQVADPALEKSILADLESRDKQDSERAVAPLKPAPDAVHIDSTDLTVPQVEAAIVELMDKARATPKTGVPTDVDAGRDAVPVRGTSRVGDAPDTDTATREVAPRDSAETSAGEGEGKAKAPKKEDVPMIPFHNTFADYYDHGMREFPWPSRAIYSVACGVVYGFTKLMWPWSYEGLPAFISELRHREKGTVIIMNHVAMVEPVITVAMMWRHGFRVRPVFKEEFNANDFMRWVFSRVGGIPVDRGTADLKAVRRCQRAIQRGESILIYPEGTRVRTDDGTATIHGGFALIAQLAKTDVTPMAVVGARDVTPEGSKIPRHHRVWFKIGAPIRFGTLGVKGRKKQLEAMEHNAMERVMELRAELRREHPGEW